MHVLAWDKHMPPAKAEELNITLLGSPTEVAAAADILTVHLALVPETRGLIGDGVFASMKQGTIFINTSRAEVVDQASLERAIKERGIRAGLDVFAEEPSGGVGDVERQHLQAPPASSGRITSARPPTRRKRRSPRRQSASSGSSRRPGALPTSSTSRRNLRRPTSSPCVTTIASASSLPSSTA